MSVALLALLVTGGDERLVQPDGALRVGLGDPRGGRLELVDKRRTRVRRCSGRAGALPPSRLRWDRSLDGSVESLGSERGIITKVEVCSYSRTCDESSGPGSCRAAKAGSRSVGCTSTRRSRKPPATSFLQRPGTSPSDFKELVGLRTPRSARGGAEFVKGPGQATAVARRVAFWDRSGGNAVGGCHRCSRRGGAVERLQARIRYRGVEFGQHSGWRVPVALRQPGARCGGPR